MQQILTDNPAPKHGAGFTLIELLIAVSIIVILSVLALTGYQSVYKSSRDAKRQSDLKFIQSALEDYHADQLYYPKTGDITPGSPLTFGSKTYLTKVPNDPLGNHEYSYGAYKSATDLISTCNNTTIKCYYYCLWADMEIDSNARTVTTCPPATGTTYDYAVTVP